MQLTLQDVSFRYSQGTFELHAEQVLIDQGSVVGVIGPNGAGKTTFLCLCAGILGPLSGQVILGGRNIRQAREEGRIACCLQGLEPKSRLALDRWLVGAWAIRTGRTPSPLEVQRHAEECGVLPFLDKKLDTLSAGQRLAGMLALATAGEWDLLVLDEPFAVLDQERRILWKERIQEYRRSGKTLVISSHNLAEIEPLCTDFVFIRDGAVSKAMSRSTVGQGNAARLRVRGNVQQLILLLGETVLASRETVPGEAELQVDLSSIGSVSNLAAKIEEAGGHILEIRAGTADIERAYEDTCHD